MRRMCVVGAIWVNHSCSGCGAGRKGGRDVDGTPWTLTLVFGAQSIGVLGVRRRLYVSLSLCSLQMLLKAC